MIDVSNRLIQLFMCQTYESLLWLLNKRSLQIISVISITELEQVYDCYKHIPGLYIM